MAQTTFHDLHCWKGKLVSDFGWILLAAVKSDVTKMNAYKDDISALLNAIDAKSKQVENPDKQKDLVIMKEQLSLLSGCVDHCLQPAAASSMPPPPDATVVPDSSVPPMAMDAAPAAQAGGRRGSGKKVKPSRSRK